MTTEVIGRYLTQSGKVGLEVTKNTLLATGRVSYSYTGEWGAGSGSDRAEVRDRVLSTVAFKRHARVVMEFEL